MTINRGSFEAAREGARGTAEMPELGGTMHIRELTIRDWSTARRRARTVNENGDVVAMDEGLLAALVVQAGACHEDGTRIFPAEPPETAKADLDFLLSCPASVINRAYVAIAGLGSFTRKAIEDAEKNSERTASGTSS